MKRAHQLEKIFSVFCVLGITACSNNALNQASESPIFEIDSQRIASLAMAVSKAEDLSAIKKLQKSYGYYLDKGMWTDLAEFFTEDAVANYPAGIYKGKASIRQHLYRNVGGVEVGEVGLGDGRLYNHMNMQPVVHLDAAGDTARGRWRVMTMLGDYGRGPGSWADGVYNMKYAKENGVWKISDLQYHTGYVASYTDGWGANPEVEARQDLRKLPHPADEERNMSCDGFPDACIAEFYYDNLGNSGDSNVWTLPSSFPMAKVDNPKAVISDLLHRAQLLKYELDIENLQRIYGYYLDRKMWDELAELFAENGSIEMGQQGIYEGKSRVRAFLNLLGDEGLKYGELNDHFQLQTIVSVAADGKSAKARSREWNMKGELQKFGEWSAGLYENSFVKIEGEWKIQALHYYPTFITDYDLGWTLDALPTPGVSEVLAPDSPPSVVYEIYPKAHIPAFHYLNPVTGKAPSYPDEKGGTQSSFDATSLAVNGFQPALVNDGQIALVEAERLIERVKDHQEIENLENAYGYYLDKNLWNDLADLFSVDGSMELAQRGVYKGRERVREFLFTVFGDEGPVPGRLGNHLHMQPVIHVNDDGGTALVRSRMMQQLSFSGRPSMGSAIYVNELVKEEGAWKFKSTHAFNTWTARYAGGWKDSPVEPRVPGPSDSFPPDELPSVKFLMYPNIYDLPFHY